MAKILAAETIAASLAVGYLMGIGVISGQAFAQNFWASLALSLAIAGIVALSIEIVRRCRISPSQH